MGQGGGVDAGPHPWILGGEAFHGRIYAATRTATSPVGSNVFNTVLLVGWDEPGGTYDHVPPGPVPPPDPAAPAGEARFTFHPSGYPAPALLVSPPVEPGSGDKTGDPPHPPTATPGHTRAPRAPLRPREPL